MYNLIIPRTKRLERIVKEMESMPIEVLERIVKKLGPRVRLNNIIKNTALTITTLSGFTMYAQIGMGIFFPHIKFPFNERNIYFIPFATFSGTIFLYSVYYLIRYGEQISGMDLDKKVSITYPGKDEIENDELYSAKKVLELKEKNSSK